MKTRVIGLIVSLLTIIYSFSYASTNTLVRTEEDLGIRDGIEVTASVRKAALNTPRVNAQEKIYDFADLLTENEEELLYNKIMNYIHTYSMDMVLVTINRNNKGSAMEYADDFYDYNDFGTDEVHSGILFLIDMDTREMWISTTGQAIMMYDDYRIERILDDTYAYVTSNVYQCEETFISKASSYASQGIPQSNQSYEINRRGDYEKKSGILLMQEAFDWTKGKHNVNTFFIMTFLFALITTWILYKKNKTVKTATHANHYILRTNWIKKDDHLISSHTTKVYNPPSSSGGGSSTHSGSSGISHGGGGRHF